ncbi:MAG: hypothetical protein KF817_11495 [Phycisphaeraceae bacterium]|nr:hypothetical protein [Phycisphaeraceae bacterium]
MRWPVFACALFTALVVDASLAPAFAIGNATIRSAPVLLALVALHAARWPALWAAWCTGFCIDLLVDLPQGAHAAGPVLGPHALAASAAVAGVLGIRSVLRRDRAPALAATATLIALFLSLVPPIVYAVHALYDPVLIHWRNGATSSELLSRLGGSMLTGLAALPLALLLRPFVPLFGFRMGAGWSR